MSVCVRACACVRRSIYAHAGTYLCYWRRLRIACGAQGSPCPTSKCSGHAFCWGSSAFRYKWHPSRLEHCSSDENCFSAVSPHSKATMPLSTEPSYIHLPLSFRFYEFVFLYLIWNWSVFFSICCWCVCHFSQTSDLTILLLPAQTVPSNDLLLNRNFGKSIFNKNQRRLLHTGHEVTYLTLLRLLLFLFVYKYIFVLPFPSHSPAVSHT